MRKNKPVFWAALATLALLASPSANGALTRIYTDEIKNATSVPALGIVQGDLLTDTLTKVGQQGTTPLRLYATGTDSLLHIGATLVSAGDGSGRVQGPLANTLVPGFADTTIDFQATSSFVSPSGNVLTDGAAFALPTTTIGQFRQMVLVWRSDGKVDTHFSPAAASVGALQNVGTTFAALPGTQKLGYVVLEATASAKYKTAGSATSIIQAAVSGTSRIVAVSGSGGGSGSPLTTAGDLYYFSTQDDRLPLGGATTVLHGGVSAPSYSAVTLTTDVTGVLPTGNGGTGQNSTASFPTSGVVLTETSTDQGASRVQNKDLDTGSVVFVNPADTTKKIAFSNTGNSGTTATIRFNSAATATYFLPDTADTIVGRTQTETLTGKTMSGASNTFTNIPLTTAVTGTLPVGNGGTGTASAPSNGQLLIGNGTNYTLATITGTANQISVSNLTGSITLSTPQSIGTGSSPTFAGLTVTALTPAGFVKNSVAGVLSTAASVALGTDVTGTLSTLLGGTGQTSTAVFPTSGTVDTIAGSNTLTNHTISATTNILSNLASEQDFTGTGAQTDFTLSGALSSGNFVMVYVDGRLQRVGGGFSYTRTNANPGHIVFTSAPNNGSWVAVVVVQQN